MKRIFSIVLLILVCLMLVFGWVGWQHYYLWPNSVSLFQLRHQAFSHLALYTNSWTYQAGDTLTVYGSAKKDQSLHLTMHPLLAPQKIVWSEDVSISYQPVPDSGSIMGMNWKDIAKVAIPEGLNTGWYILAGETDHHKWNCSVFIRPQDGKVKHKVAIILSTNTWNAYNHWGGQSLYTRNYTPSVSFDRPQLLGDPELADKWEYHQLVYQSAIKDKYVVQCLAEAGILLDAYAMSDLEQGLEVLKDYDLWIISTHAEYWTEKMLVHLNQYLDQRGSLMSLSGNTAAYVSELHDDQRTLTVYKGEDNLWLHVDTVGFRPFGSINHLSIFQQYAPYEILQDTSWVLAGTGLEKGALIGKQSNTYDYTLMFGNPWENMKMLWRRGNMAAASGLEIDKVLEGEKVGWVPVARGLNYLGNGRGEIYPESPYQPGHSWDGAGGADLGYYIHPGGGIVFNVNSLSFTGSIPYDPHIRQMIINVAKKALTSPVE